MNRISKRRLTHYAENSVEFELVDSLKAERKKVAELEAERDDWKRTATEQAQLHDDDCRKLEAQLRDSVVESGSTEYLLRTRITELEGALEDVLSLHDTDRLSPTECNAIDLAQRTLDKEQQE